MSELSFRWMVDIARETWASLSGAHRPPTFMDIPQDVFLNICSRLCVKDILTLRMTNKCVAQSTLDPMIWSFFLRRLNVPLPVLPATSRYHFGSIKRSTYEYLMRRGLYLEQNWRRQNPRAAHSHFEAFGRTLIIKMLPGGKYMVSVTKNLEREEYALMVWDLDNAGRRVVLTGATSSTPFLKMEVKFGLVRSLVCDGEMEDVMCIVIAYAKPPVQTETGDLTHVRAVCVPIVVLEELASQPNDSEVFRTIAETLELPFRIIHQSSTHCDVGQLALGDFDDQLVLVVVHRPRALVFHYLDSGKRGNLLLGPVRPYDTVRNSIWSVKLLTGQNSILVSRVLVEAGSPLDSTLFALDVFLLPGPGSSYKDPMCIGRQLISGLHADGFYFSDLETSWFTSLRDPRGLLPAPANREPPPISLFITTKAPRGFVHCLLRPVVLPNEVVKLPGNQGWMRRYVYQLPAQKVERHTWKDDYARPVVLPGAYRSIISMRPHVKPAILEEGSAAALGGVEVLRFCTFGTKAEGYEKFATPRTTARLCTPTIATTQQVQTEDEGEDGGEAEAIDVEVEEEEPSLSATLEEELGFRKRSLRVPSIPDRVAWSMMYGTTAMGWDESTGRMCVATTEGTEVNMLDFGGETWEAGVVCV